MRDPTGQDTMAPRHGSVTDGHDSEFGATCTYTNCKEPTISGVPLCLAHLTHIKSKAKKQIVPSPIRAKKAVLPSGSAITYLRRKTASNGVPRASSFSKTSYTAPKTTQPISVNGALPTPSSRTRGEGSYFASATIPKLSHGENDRSADISDSTSGANAFLTPVESPPELRANGSKKRSRSEFQDGEPQPTGADEAQPGKGKEVLPLVPPRWPSEPPTHAIVDQDTRMDEPNPAIAVDDPPTRTEHRGDDAAASLSTSEQRASLFRRMREDRDREQDRNRKTLPETMPLSLDSYIYNQGSDVAPLPPPPNVVIATKARLAAAAAAARPATYSSASSCFPSHPPAYVYAHIDPRVHWTRTRSAEWHDAKQKEVKARGGRKTNFGMAPQRTATQQRLLLGKVGLAAAAGTAVGDTAVGDTAVGDTAVGDTAAAGSNGSSSSSSSTRSTSDTGSGAAAAAAVNGVTPPQQQPKPPKSASSPPPRRPAVWTGELPPDVVRNRNWTTMLGMFAQDEDDRRMKHIKPYSRYRGRY